MQRFPPLYDRLFISVPPFSVIARSQVCLINRKINIFQLCPLFSAIIPSKALQRRIYGAPMLNTAHFRSPPLGQVRAASSDGVRELHRHGLGFSVYCFGGVYRVFRYFPVFQWSFAVSWGSRSVGPQSRTKVICAAHIIIRAVFFMLFNLREPPYYLDFGRPQIFQKVQICIVARFALRPIHFMRNGPIVGWRCIANYIGPDLDL